MGRETNGDFGSFAAFIENLGLAVFQKSTVIYNMNELLVYKHVITHPVMRNSHTQMSHLAISITLFK